MDTLPNTIGVIVGRFQVARLHAGHRRLIDTARASHEKLLIIIGNASFPTPRNPLTYEMRRAMLLKDYPTAEICQIEDHSSDSIWSETLDVLIETMFSGNIAVLYGSRDSFIPRYSGKYRAVEIEELRRFSGTIQRQRTATKLLSSPAFRAGVIYNFMTRLAVTWPMVDIAVVRNEYILLGGKNTDAPNLWRFIGGLVDPTDATLEDAALRELHEEALNIEVAAPRYLGSQKIEDWRYKDCGESGMTTLFRSDYVSGTASAGDDLDRVAWKKISDLPSCLVPEHVALGQMLLKSLAENPERIIA